MTCPAIYAIVVGLLIFGQWAFFLITRQVPELKTERVRVFFHIADEFLTAAVLIVSGVGLLARSHGLRPSILSQRACCSIPSL